MVLSKNLGYPVFDKGIKQIISGCFSIEPLQWLGLPGDRRKGYTIGSFKYLIISAGLATRSSNIFLHCFI